MDHSLPDDSSTSLPLSTAVQRTRSQSHQRQRPLCRRAREFHREATAAADGACNANDPAARGDAAPNIARDPRASHRQSGHCRRRRRETVSAVVAAALLLCAPSLLAPVDSAFASPPSRRPGVGAALHPATIPRRTAPRPRHDTADAPRPHAVRPTSDLRASRFGVRQRVRSALGKAKKRNTSASRKGSEKRRAKGDAYFVQSGLNIIAETASIGGLDLVVGEEGGVDVSLDYISRGMPPPDEKNNNDTGAAEEVLSSGEKYEDPAILTKLGEEVNGAAIKNGAVNGAAIKNGAKARPPPSSAPAALQRPEDAFVLRSKESANMANSTARSTCTEKEAFAGDVSAAFSLPREPLPFALPVLDREQSRRLAAGERVQFQDDMGRAGSGYVVWDVKAPAAVVWDCLLDFPSYPQTIPTVREVVTYPERPRDPADGAAAACRHGVPSVTRAQFSLSKFRLKIAAVHKYRPHPKGDYMIFTLDPASRNPVLKYAKGIWYTESHVDGKEGYTRVWLLCELRVSRLLPQWIVDYAAARAMPRATTWLKPMTEAAATLWLKE